MRPDLYFFQKKATSIMMMNTRITMIGLIWPGTRNRFSGPGASIWVQRAQWDQGARGSSWPNGPNEFHGPDWCARIMSLARGPTRRNSKTHEPCEAPGSDMDLGKTRKEATDFSGYPVFSRISWFSKFWVPLNLSNVPLFSDFMIFLNSSGRSIFVWTSWFSRIS